MPRLTEYELNQALESLPEWIVADGKLHREYKFDDFGYAFGFMAAAAPAIGRMNHHPEWFNVYNRVVVYLTTHDAGGITKRDVELATLLDEIAKRLA